MTKSTTKTKKERKSKKSFTTQPPIPWLYNGEALLEAPEDAFGFVYFITNTFTGQSYIGKKQFWSFLTKKVFGKKNRTHYKKESDWKTYFSSCPELKEDLKLAGSTHIFKREIVQICATRGALTYGELEYQIKNDVLKAKLGNGRQAFYNRNILNKFFIMKEDLEAELTMRSKNCM